MITNIIDILKAYAPLDTALGSGARIYPSQRQQGIEGSAVVVHKLGIRTSETKHRSSDLDFHDIEIHVIGITPLTCEEIGGHVRDALDMYRGTLSGSDIEIRFEDEETGVHEDPRLYALIQNYVVMNSRASLSPHT